MEEIEAEGVCWQRVLLCRLRQQLTEGVQQGESEGGQMHVPPALLTAGGRGVMCPMVASRHVPVPSWRGDPSPATASLGCRLGVFSAKPSWGLAAAGKKINWETNLHFFKYPESQSVGSWSHSLPSLCAFSESPALN